MYCSMHASTYFYLYYKACWVFSCKMTMLPHRILSIYSKLPFDKYGTLITTITFLYIITFIYDYYILETAAAFNYPN